MVRVGRRTGKPGRDALVQLDMLSPVKDEVRNQGWGKAGENIHMECLKEVAVPSLLKGIRA